MKILYLVRHAKSSWDHAELGDAERPLNKRGKLDAPMMGRLLASKGEHAELIISSHAKRAFSTAKRIAAELNYPKKKIEVNEELYMADSDDFYKIIDDVPDSVSRLMLFSHNYGITYFANHIAGENIDSIPTCGIVRVDFDTPSWKEIKNTKGKLAFFEYPKKNKTGTETI
jgi:phosphohistidine phosphatase